VSLWILIGLMVLGAAAILIEVFVPAAGLLGIGGLACIVFAVARAYVDHGSEVGMVFLIVALVCTPLLIYGALKAFPRSWVGRELILGEHQERETGYASYTESMYTDLVGKNGVSLTDLRPSGMALIDKKRLSVVTAGEYIGRNEAVRVLRVEGSRIVVTRAEKTS
jgi:membrane-bound serine protease (ClpP class)